MNIQLNYFQHNLFYAILFTSQLKKNSSASELLSSDNLNNYHRIVDEGNH